MEAEYWALFFACFLAATIVPFSSEAILSGMLIGGFNPIASLLVATMGNWLGGMSSYAIGRIGKVEWIHRWLRISDKSLSKVTDRITGKEGWIALLCWLPFIGDVIAVALGLLRARIGVTAIGMLVGKALRYVVWGYATLEAMHYFNA